MGKKILLDSTTGRPLADINGKLYVKDDSFVVDQTYNPQSANAQSGVAVAEAVSGSRTPFQKFINKYNLKNRNYVNLAENISTFYYANFTDAVSAINGETYKTLPTTDNSNECRIFEKEGIVVLQALKAFSITTQITFQKSVFFDLNGFTVSLSGGGKFNSTTFYDVEVAYYGAKTGSKITATNTNSTAVINIHNSKTYMLSCECELTMSTVNSVAYFIVCVPGSFSPSPSNISLEIYNSLLNNFSSTNTCGGIMYADTNAVKDYNVVIENTKIIAKTDGNTPYSSNGIVIQGNKDEPHTFIKNSLFFAICNNGLTDQASSNALNTYAIVENCTFEGIASGLQNSGILKIKNSTLTSVSHGGIYNVGNGAVLYAEACKFYQHNLSGHTPSGTAASYFGTGSIAYINNCEFIQNASPSYDGIAIKQGSGTVRTKVYMSNSVLSKLRCDANQYVYLGDGISDEIKNSTVQGIKTLTNVTYSMQDINVMFGEHTFNPNSEKAQSGLAVSEAILKANNWEQIDMYTLTTAVKMVSKNTVDLQKIFIVIEPKSAVASIMAYVYCYSGGSIPSVWCTLQNKPIESSGYIQFICDAYNLKQSQIALMKGNGDLDNTSINGVPPQYLDTKPIVSYTINVSQELPVGTQITVWGVRA